MRRGNEWTIAVAMGVVCIAPAAANAQAPSTSQILNEFNLVTTGNVSGSSSDPTKVGGNAVIGGNLSGRSTFLSGGVAGETVEAYGTVTSTSSSRVTIDSSGYLQYGTLATGSTVTYSPTGSRGIHGGFSLTSSQYTAPLTKFSSLIDTLGGSSNVSVNAISLSGGTLDFNANYESLSGIVIFDVAERSLNSLFGNNDPVKFNDGTGVSGVEAYVVNVTGDTSGYTTPNWTPSSPQTSVLFNFGGFSTGNTLTVGNFKASILAPNASVSVTNGDTLYGSLFAANFTGGTLSNNTFAGTFNLPEPATLGVFGAGIAGLVLTRARRKRREE